jgi:hypothetical protein
LICDTTSQISLRLTRPRSAGVAARAGDGEGHVRSIATEIDRPVVDLLRRRLGELRIVGKSPPLATTSMASARPAAACLAQELGQLGDGGHLAQGARRQSGAARSSPPTTAIASSSRWLDLLDELANLGGRGFRRSRWMRMSETLFSR